MSLKFGYKTLTIFGIKSLSLFSLVCVTAIWYMNDLTNFSTMKSEVDQPDNNINSNILDTNHLQDSSMNELEVQSYNSFKNFTVMANDTIKAMENSTISIESTEEPVKTKTIQSTEEPVNPKTILIWRDDKHMKSWITDHAVRQCSHLPCIFTSDQSQESKADVIVLREKVLEEDWPKHRTDSQLYVHSISERPGYWHDWLKDFDNKINLTMNYRKDSDIPIPTLGVYPRQPALDEPYVITNPFVSKTNMAVWPVSHCKAESKRDDYIKELSKYMQVDIYGNCGNFSCGVPMSKPIEYKLRRQETLDCVVQWAKKYKFYIAFENSICNDYITEKPYGALRHELIPVVLGGADYNDYTPPNSVIDARDFKSPKHLAEYLQSLASDEVEYTKFFQWKQKYVAGGQGTNVLCTLCEAVHKYSSGTPAHRHYYDWWFRGCDNDLVNRMRAAEGW